MTQLLPRALVAILLALLGVSIMSLVVIVALVGFPSDPAKLATFQMRAAPFTPQVDLIIGGLVLLACGWWAGRPFARPLALRAGLAVGLGYIAVEVAIAVLRSGLVAIDWQPTLISFTVKIVAALAGGWLAGGPAAPDPVPLDPE
ncbi:hypothetical protein GON01_07015 [Sphingomonas sp. MAH-20]|uniref:Uncharacterized protein n=1 Tax=Sphingomonas horti TaxID=2682842 RepID=A0A6I4IZT4_9SPHN|nr:MULTISPECIES: hypothetical protein [Sphingomonas]MBA2920749.1 hypothetical protein [Sphingomonas sp. CGMCC 1.13658]MVO77685.1 hypothetical protein [Sphingomonas horti]